MPAINYNSYMINHEFGHIIEEYLKEKTGLNANAIANRIKEPNKEISISDYGTKNDSEFIAESFANLVSGKPNELGKSLGKLLRSTK